VGGRQLALREVGHCAHARQPGLHDRVAGLARRARGQAPRSVEVAELRSGLCGKREPSGPRCRINRELHRPLVGGRRGRVAAAGHGLGGGALQFGRYLLVRSSCRGRQVPRPPVSVRRIMQRLGNRPVYRQPPTQHRTPVHRGAHQRMAEPDHVVGDADQPRLLGRAQVRDHHPKRPGRLPHHAEVTAALRRGDQ
jgi:hypothetical protein